MTIYDVLGRQVRTLVDGRQQAGNYQSVWDGTDKYDLPVAAGIYFCRMEAGVYAKVIKLALVK
jgi:flagellar hook assembly protein FlgD